MTTARNELTIPVIREAIKAVPAVKWALGIAGIAAALSLATSFFGSITLALIGSASMIGLMVLLVLFAKMSRLPESVLKSPALVMTWTILILLLGSSFLTFTTVFFEWPKPFQDLVRSLAIPHSANAGATDAKAVPSATSSLDRHYGKSLVVPGVAESLSGVTDCISNDTCPTLQLELPAGITFSTIAILAKDSDAAEFETCTIHTGKYIECGVGPANLASLKFIGPKPTITKTRDGRTLIAVRVINQSAKSRMVRLDATVKSE